MDYNGHRIVTLEREIRELEQLKSRGGRGLAAAIEERRIELDRRQLRAYVAAGELDAKTISQERARGIARACRL